nr:hypothetical protein GCM10020093_098330 [Planobispora longispora]
MRLVVLLRTLVPTVSDRPVGLRARRGNWSGGLLADMLTHNVDFADKEKLVHVSSERLATN